MDRDALTKVTLRLPVPMRPGETPVPIPNTTVKAWAADGTTLETAWESRRVPDQRKHENPCRFPLGCCGAPLLYIDTGFYQ